MKYFESARFPDGIFGLSAPVGLQRMLPMRTVRCMKPHTSVIVSLPLVRRRQKQEARPIKWKKVFKLGDFTSDQIHVRTMGDLVIVEAERRVGDERNCSMQKVTRTFDLPTDVDKASLKTFLVPNGVLILEALIISEQTSDKNDIKAESGEQENGADKAQDTLANSGEKAQTATITIPRDTPQDLVSSNRGEVHNETEESDVTSVTEKDVDGMIQRCDAAEKIDKDTNREREDNKEEKAEEKNVEVEMWNDEASMKSDDGSFFQVSHKDVELFKGESLDEFEFKHDDRPSLLIGDEMTHVQPDVETACEFVEEIPSLSEMACSFEDVYKKMANEDPENIKDTLVNASVVNTNDSNDNTQEIPQTSQRDANVVPGTNSHVNGPVVSEPESDFLQHISISDFNQDSISVRLEDNELTIEASREQKNGEDTLSMKKMIRTLILPSDINLDSVECKVKDDELLICALRNKGSTRTVHVLNM